MYQLIRYLLRIHMFYFEVGERTKIQFKLVVKEYAKLAWVEFPVKSNTGVPGTMFLHLFLNIFSGRFATELSFLSNDVVISLNIYK